MNTDIHRLLDEAFLGIEMTPDAQDLKEEIRANLVARADELEANGAAPAAAAQQAVAELGDVRALLDETTVPTPTPGAADASPGASGRVGPASPRGDARGYAALQLQHRVRPKPAFVARVMVWSIAAMAGIVLGILGATGVLSMAVGGEIALFGLAATGLGLLVGDSLSQETTTNHPMPQNRAGAYALATWLGAYGLGFGGLVALGALPVWVVLFAAVGIIASIILFAFLGATQTNRHKAWTRQAFANEPPNRFEREPETAARFGIYTVAIWLVTFAVIAVLVFTVGWWWAPIAFVGGFALMMLVLARMMFGPEKTPRA